VIDIVLIWRRFVGAKSVGDRVDGVGGFVVMKRIYLQKIEGNITPG
jgi:hypothetical protein